VTTDSSISTVAAGVAAESRLRKQLLTLWLPRIAGYVAFYVFWTWASGTLVSASLLPTPAAILSEMGEIARSGELWTHFGSTLQRIGIGWGIAFLLGGAIGIAMRHRWWDGFFRDWVVTTMTTPGLVFALLAAMVFGFSPIGPIVAIVVTTFPFFTVNIAEGVKAMPKDLFDMSRAFGVPAGRRMRHVVIPFLAPYIFAAMRYGFSIAWKIATLTELFGSSRGIGFMMRREYQLFNITGLLAWIFFFFAFALLLEKVVLQRGIDRFFRWRQTVAT
jgi:NitT/TauT family transport system permease protein